MACLTESGLLKQLDPSLQTSLVENQEKLATALAFLSLQASLTSHLSSPSTLPSASQQTLADSLDLIEGISARSWLFSTTKGSSELKGGQRANVEMFYSQPTLSTPHLFKVSPSLPNLRPHLGLSHHLSSLLSSRWRRPQLLSLVNLNPTLDPRKVF